MTPWIHVSAAEDEAAGHTYKNNMHDNPGQWCVTTPTGRRGPKRARTFFRGIISVLIIAIFSFPSLASAKTVTVETQQARIRKGAGNYYEIIYRASKGAELEVLGEKDGWYEVRLPEGGSGYVSVKSISKRDERRKPPIKDLLEDKGVGKVASSEIMAATKGVTEMGRFAASYAKKYNADPSVMEQFNNIPFSPSEFEGYRATLPKSEMAGAGMLSTEGIAEIDRELGTAIAIRMCQKGVSTNNELRKYVSLVGTALLENTPLDDETFIYIVLDEQKVQSFALPGGYVFLTKGALGLMRDEAELAGVLGHEISHVVQRHGIREIERQKTRIAGEKLMDALDEEVDRLGMDQGDRQLMEELDQMADQMFELIISGRKKETEDESDRLGTIILYNTGFRPDGLKEFILSTGEIEQSAKDPSYSHRSAKDRAGAIDRFLKRQKLKVGDRKSFSSRYKECALDRVSEKAGQKDMKSKENP